jgi:hypothetical protein
MALTLSADSSIADSFNDLSFAADELEAAMVEAALACAADACADTSFAEVARSQSCIRFLEALTLCGLASELPALHELEKNADVPRLTVLAPTDAAIDALPEAVRTDREALRRWCAAHICVGDCTGEMLHSLQGTVHAAEYPAGRDAASAAAHDACRIGNARVTGALPFAHGCLLRTDAVLHALHVEAECRPEQVCAATTHRTHTQRTANFLLCHVQRTANFLL